MKKSKCFGEANNRSVKRFFDAPGSTDILTEPFQPHWVKHFHYSWLNGQIFHSLSSRLWQSSQKLLRGARRLHLPIENRLERSILAVHIMNCVLIRPYFRSLQIGASVCSA